MIYAYCRISRREQNIERQVRNIKEFEPQAVVIKEAFTGTTMERPAWQRLYKAVKSGDTIIFDSVSRLSRDAAEGLEVYEALYKRGVTLCFMKEPYINTDVYKAAAAKAIPMTGNSVDIILEAVNQYLLILAKEQIKLAFAQAEKEVTDLHQRTKEGLITAKLNGKRVGASKGDKYAVKKAAAAKAIIKAHAKAFGGTLADGEVMKLAGVSRNTYYKYKAEIAAAEAGEATAETDATSGPQGDF